MRHPVGRQAYHAIRPKHLPRYLAEFSYRSDSRQATGSEKYGLDQGDFYQLHAYGQNYLDGDGDVVLIYPKTDAFSNALPVFEFPKSSGLRLWVLPFCLEQKRLQLPSCGSLNVFFVAAEAADSVVRKVRIPASVDRFQTVTSSS